MQYINIIAINKLQYATLNMSVMLQHYFMVPNTTTKFTTGGLCPCSITPMRLSTHVSRLMPIWMCAAIALLKKVAVETLPGPHSQLSAKMPSTIVKSNR